MSENKKFTPIRVQNQTGSCAGAGSGEFHIYRHHRRREQYRLRQMEEEHKNAKEKKEFEAKLNGNRNKCEIETKKRASKRQKQKLRKKLAKLRGKGDFEAVEKLQNSERAMEPQLKRSKISEMDIPSVKDQEINQEDDEMPKMRIIVEDF